MLEDKSRDIESVRKRWDAHVERYDGWYETFEGAVEHYVDWELLKGYLPQNRDAKILDAAGGTGRIILPLAKMGYSVTLCDISSGMLNMAGQKLLREGVSDKVEILECDVCKLRFADESFDFVLCWEGMIEAAKESYESQRREEKFQFFSSINAVLPLVSFAKTPILLLLCLDQDRIMSTIMEKNMWLLAWKRLGSSLRKEESRLSRSTPSATC